MVGFIEDFLWIFSPNIPTRSFHAVPIERWEMRAEILEAGTQHLSFLSLDKPIRSASSRVLWAWMMADPGEILPFIAKILCNLWLPPLICSSECTDHRETLNYNSEKSVDSLQTCRDIIRVYTKRFFMVLPGKSVSK